MELLHFLNFIALLAILSIANSTRFCPYECTCSGGFPYTNLTVDCHRSVSVTLSRQQLTELLNSLLAINLEACDNLRSLTITNTPLTKVQPLSICEFTMLRELRLDNNRLSRLPDNCLSRLSHLTLLDASFNHITELQDGIFDGLHKLKRLILNDNSIFAIGLRVFHCPLKLRSLTEVNLRKNRIQTLEPWPIYLGFNRQVYPQTLVDLGANNISIFSNNMGCVLHCGMQAVYLNLMLDHNPIKHVSDILHGWNISLTTFMCLSPNLHQKASFYISFHYVKFECDCVDYDIYRIVFSSLFRDGMLNKAYCNSPAMLYSKLISSVPMDQFVCVLTERCPRSCQCVHQPANATLRVYCSNTNLTKLPLKLPALPKSYTKYKLDFSNNRHLRLLEHRDYFANTSRLDLRNCNLQSVDIDVWNELANISQVFLDGNQLRSLPSSVATVNLEKTHIGLGRNPWSCSCDASWMPSWLISVNNSLIAPHTIGCFSNGKQIFSILSDKYICEITQRCPSGCKCVHYYVNATLHVYCSKANFTVLPLKLPTLPNRFTKYALDFSNNPRLPRLEHRDYFVNTSVLDLSNCNLDSVDVKACNALENISLVLLDGNQLQSLPSSIATLNLFRTNISLGRNPWKCSCDASWMSDWLRSTKSSLITPYAIICSSPAKFRNRNIMSIDRKAFCGDPTSEAVKRALEISVPLTAGTFVVLSSIGFIIYRLRVKLYSRWQFHPFDRDECLGEDMNYDVFLSCCSGDNLAHSNGIRVQLEQRGYSVCYPSRDFVAGEAIYDNIYNAVVRSKRTVCLLTEHFLQSGYCMLEFDVAFHHNIMVKRKKRLVVLMALDNPANLYASDASDAAALRHYLRQYTYIDYKTDDWLDNLLYALPLHGMLQDRQAARANQQENEDLL